MSLFTDTGRYMLEQCHNGNENVIGFNTIHSHPENTQKLMGFYMEILMLGIILQCNVLEYNYGFCFVLFLIRVHGFKKRAHLKLNVDFS